MIVDLVLPAPLPGVARAASVRRATRDDLVRVVELVASDAIARGRGDADDGDLAEYRAAFDAIAADPSNELVVVDTADGIVGTMQLTRIPGLSRRGSTRLQVEAVRIAAEARGTGLGSAMLAWASDVAAVEVGADLVQLTSDARRGDALRFYERAGFTASHVGFKRDAG